MGSSEFEHHDHNHCIDKTLTQVQAKCRADRLKLTPVRRRVLEILLQEHRALGAYDILAVLRAEGLGSQPPVVYRALEFLMAHGFVHKVQKLNAFIACTRPGHTHVPAFLICRNCETIAETASQQDGGRLAHMAQNSGFVIENLVMEAEGICPRCTTSS